jgi:hypothetical protein
MAERVVDPASLLQARMIALQLVVQDMLGRQAAIEGDFNGFLDRVHAGVHDDLTRFQLDGRNPALDQTILMYAGAAIDEIFAPIRKGPA